MTDDAELLQRYARERAEEAFAELVRRHLALVYHAALRQCGGDTHLAEDAAQAVFVDLARKAAALAEHRALAGWLHTAARHAARQKVRAASRRQVREQEAHKMNATLAEDAPAVDAEKLRPVLDDALDALGETDRAAVLLRFFEGRGYAEIGASLALNEDAARRRVDRALEKLRGLLARRGITSTAEALALALAGEAALAAPAGLAATVTGAGVAMAPAGGVAAALIFMSMTKIQIGAAIAVLAIGAAGLVWQRQMNTELKREVARMQTQDAELAKLRTANDRLIAKSVEQAQAALAQRATAQTPPSAPAASGAAGAARAESGVPLAPGLVPVTSLGNAGRATPRAAFATQLWAARGGDVELEATTLTFDDAARAKLEALRATLSDELRAQYPTPEQLMAFVLAGSPHPVGGMLVTGETPQDADHMTLHTQWQHLDDDIVHQSDMQFRREADGWKWVVPMSLVNRAAAYLRYTGASTPAGSGGK